MAERKYKDAGEDEEFLRWMIFPEEDRHKFTTTPWRGGYRWFRSPNVIPLEHYRRPLEIKSPEIKPNPPRPPKAA